MGTTTYAAASSSAADCAIYSPGWGAGSNGEPAKCPQGSYAGANLTCKLVLLSAVAHLMLLLPLMLLRWRLLLLLLLGQQSVSWIVVRNAGKFLRKMLLDTSDSMGLFCCCCCCCCCQRHSGHQMHQVPRRHHHTRCWINLHFKLLPLRPRLWRPRQILLPQMQRRLLPASRHQPANPHRQFAVPAMSHRSQIQLCLYT
jgi:hypothetical protein